MKKNELAARLIWAFYAWVSRAVPITAPISTPVWFSFQELPRKSKTPSMCDWDMCLADPLSLPGGQLGNLLGIHGEICLVVWSAEGTN